MDLANFFRLFTKTRASANQGAVNEKSPDWVALHQLLTSSPDTVDFTTLFASIKLPPAIDKHCAALAPMLTMKANWHATNSAVRIVPLVGRIEAGQHAAMKAYLTAAKRMPPAPLWIVINSTGGQVFEGVEIWKLIQEVKYSGCPVGVIVAEGADASSCASFIFAGGSIGLRYAHAKSRVLVHQPRLHTESGCLFHGNADREAKKFAASAEEMHICLEKSGFNYKGGLLALSLSDSNCPSSAKQAQDLGIVDEVFTEDINLLKLDEIWHKRKYQVMEH